VVSKTENNRTLAVRTSRWKLVTDDRGVRLYDLASDPEESTDVSETYPDIVSALSQAAARHRETQAEKGAIGTAVTDCLADGSDL
jgi:arylsulfatase